MTQMEILAPSRTTPNGYKVDVSRGQRIGRVSSEWFNRPDDERYLGSMKKLGVSSALS